METKDRILQKAHELFNKYGIRRVTMDEIATQIGMSKKTIYQVFKDKDELVDAVAADHITNNKCRCDLDRTKADNAVHQIFLTIDMVQEMLSKMNATILYDLEKFHPGTFSKFLQFRDNFLYKVVEENLVWGIKDGLYREDINIDVMTKLRLSTMFIPFDQDIFPQSKYNLAQVERETIEHFLYGVATAKAHKLIGKYKQQRSKQ
jgi:AcrR family transcriptional regulator